MGDQNVKDLHDESQKRDFMKNLLEDVHVMEEMLDGDYFETDIRRIGAEQEMFIIDRSGLPANKCDLLLKEINDPRFTHELGKFNLEANLSPQVLTGTCLSDLEAEVREVMQKARDAASRHDAGILLTGILPTLRRSHLGLDSMVPKPRYYALNEALKKMRGSDFKLNIKGIDQLEITHDNLMLEACNTSFQVHFQVAPAEFASLYNLAQVVTAPLMAAAVNSPLLLGKRLWRETRIAVFEHSIDARSETMQERGQLPRVHFGDTWIDDSVIEIFKEDIARFRVLLSGEESQNSRLELDEGRIPRFRALMLHNGTVYRWNRACYGVTEGKPHLRIENRVIPSGPTILDEMANAAFFYGMLSAYSVTESNIPSKIAFEDVRNNFFMAAREGLRAQVCWLNGECLPVRDLIRNELLPAAREGLARLYIPNEDIDRYLGVIEQRVESGKTGAQWILDSLQHNDKKSLQDLQLRSLVKAMEAEQKKEQPVHSWPLADIAEPEDWRDSYLTVNSFMTTDLFTVRPDDLVDFAASLMDWKHVRHVPVEDDSGQLVGLVSHRSLLRLVAQGRADKNKAPAVREIMKESVETIDPDTATIDAIRLMREKRLSCLPVVRNGKLVGIVTERDLIEVAGKLLEEQLQN